MLIFHNVTCQRILKNDAKPLGTYVSSILVIINIRIHYYDKWLLGYNLSYIPDGMVIYFAQFLFCSRQSNWMAYAKNIILAVMLFNKMFKNKNQIHLVAKKLKAREKTILGESADKMIIFI